jgi:glycosyltransferase involved in cell wall biosynthesis
MRREQYDIVHVHNVITAVLGRIAARLARIPIVLYTLHGFYFHENMSPPIRWANVLLERFCGRFTDFVLSQADEDRRTAITEHIVVADRIVTIGNGVDIDRFGSPSLLAASMQTKQELGIPLNAPVVGTIGRIVREKGFQEFFEAAVQVVRRCPEAMFLIVGDSLDSDRGKFSTQLRALIRENGMESKFFFTGFRVDVERFYPIMDIFALPSYREGMPRTIIEAMAAGRPVVATNIRGCREEVVDGETGYLVPVRDSHALAAALLKVLNDPPHARRMGQAGQRRAQELFDERLVCERIIAAYQTIVEEKAIIVTPQRRSILTPYTDSAAPLGQRGHSSPCYRGDGAKSCT